MQQTASTRRRERYRLIVVVVAGLYAWSVSVLPLLGDLSTWPALCGLGAALALSVSPFVPNRRLSLYGALHIFLAGCLLCWWGARERATLNPWSAYAALGWIAYTLALGSLTTPERGEQGSQLRPQMFRPRVQPSKAAALCIGSGLLATIALNIYSFQVSRPELLMLAHLAALATGLIVLKQTVLLAEYFQQKTQFGPYGSGVWWLFIALLLLVSGGLVSGWATAIG